MKKINDGKEFFSDSSLSYITTVFTANPYIVSKKNDIVIFTWMR